MILIKREDAIEEISKGVWNVHELIDRINTLPSAELTLQTPQTYGKSINPSNAEVVEDLISRADAIKAVCNAQCELDVPHYPQCDQLKYCEDIQALLALPSADTVSREFYNDAVKANIRLVIENSKLKEQIESAEAESGDLIIKGAKGIKDGLYNIKDGKLFEYKAKGGTVRTYPIVPSADAVPIHEDGTLEVKVPNAHKVGRVLVMDTDSHIGGGLFYPAEADWIPCSERLPNTNGIYIVTRRMSDGFECRNLTDACYFDGTSTWHDDTRVNHERKYLTDVLAWMPLPKPYREDGEA